MFSSFNYNWGKIGQKKVKQGDDKRRAWQPRGFRKLLFWDLGELVNLSILNGFNQES